MGMYTIDCVQCKTTFLWFSGTMDQRCDSCRKGDQNRKVDPNKLQLYFHPSFPEALYVLVTHDFGRTMFVLSDEYIGIDGEMEYTKCTFPLDKKDITATFEYLGEL